MNKTLKIILFIAVAVILLDVIAFAVYTRWEEAPRQVAESPVQPKETAPLDETPNQDELESLQTEKPATQKKDGVYTILLVGIDDASDQTDTIIVGKIDTNEHSMNFVSIPRDTLVNVAWDTKKINTVYYGTERSHGTQDEAISALRQQVKNIMGYDVDCYAFISIRAFVDVIDAMGGVFFDVPDYVAYIDQTNEYWVFLAPGYQHLNGVNAMGVVRFRETYPTADLGRIEVQHDFLKAVADQCLSLGTIPHAKQIIDIIRNETETDLSAANIAFFMRQAMMCKSENIRFMTVPASNQFLNDLSYAVIHLDDWMAMLNEYMNPFDENMTYGNVNIIFRNYFGYGCTGGFLDPAFFAAANEEIMRQNNGESGTEETQKPETPETPQAPQNPEPSQPEVPQEPEPEPEPVQPEAPTAPEPVIPDTTQETGE